MSAFAAAAERESVVAARWAAGFRAALRLEDGRALKVVFPGVPGGGSGPDFRGAILDAGGDLLRGDVEIHLLASGWRAHGHHLDPAYGGVVLHAVAANDSGALATLHSTGRAIAILVLPVEESQAAFPPPFTPPCTLAAALGRESGQALERLGLRRLRIKAARAAPLVAAAGPSQALYALALEILGGPPNRAAFASLARRLPLAALLERVEGGLDPPPAADRRGTARCGGGALPAPRGVAPDGLAGAAAGRGGGCVSPLVAGERWLRLARGPAARSAAARAAAPRPRRCAGDRTVGERRAARGPGRWGLAGVRLRGRPAGAPFSGDVRQAEGPRSLAGRGRPAAVPLSGAPPGRPLAARGLLHERDVRTLPVE